MLLDEKENVMPPRSNSRAVVKDSAIDALRKELPEKLRQKVIPFQGRDSNQTLLELEASVPSSIKASVHNLSTRFKLPSQHTFTQQYSQIYFVRLATLRPFVLSSLKSKWLKPSPSTDSQNLSSSLSDGAIPPKLVKRVLDVVEDERCCLVGTLYMEMPLKPNILNEIGLEYNVQLPPLPDKCVSEKDEIFLEDESGRLALSVNPALQEKFRLTTGMIVAVLGKETKEHGFVVEDVCFAGLAPQEPRKALEVDAFIALASDLQLGSEKTSDVAINSLLQYLRQEQHCNVVQLLVTGNLMATPKRLEDATKSKRIGVDSTVFDTTPLKHGDAFLDGVLQYLPVTLSPGSSDPTGLALPQQAIPRGLLMRSKRHSTSHLNLVTNPSHLLLGNLRILATSGQNIDDMYRFAQCSDRLALAETTLFLRHMAPTAPDTLWTFPFHDRDPFILDQTPDLYAIGCQPLFETKLVQGAQGQKCCIVLVPSFQKTRQIVLVNVRTLVCRLVTFHI